MTFNQYQTDRRRIVGAALAGMAAGVATAPVPAAAGVGVASRPLRITVAAQDAPAYIKAEILRHRLPSRR